MSEHTKGPWRIGDAGTTIFGPKTDAPSPVTIANISPSNRLTRGERRANAALIAAAPDLLEALKAVMEGQIGGNPDLGAQRFRQARAAIAKAEGVQS